MEPGTRRLAKIKALMVQLTQTYIEKLQREKIVEIIEEAVEYLIQVLASKT